MSSLASDTHAARRAAVLARLRAAVATRRRKRVARPWDEARLRAALQRVEAARDVNPHLPIAWPTWPPGVWPKLVAVAQKVTRRLLAWYINPIVAQQNGFNHATADTVEALHDALDALAAENARLHARLAETEARLAELEPPSPV